MENEKPTVSFLSSVRSALSHPLFTWGVLIIFGLGEGFFNRSAGVFIPNIGVIIAVLVFVCIALALVVLVLGRVAYEASTLKILLPWLFIGSLVGFVVARVLLLFLPVGLAADRGSGSNAIGQALLTVSYVALMLMVLSWAVRLAIHDQPAQPAAPGEPAGLKGARYALAELLAPIPVEGIQLTSIRGARRGRLGDREYVIRLQEPAKEQDTRGEWITIQRESAFVLKLDRQGQWVSFEPQKEKS